jgi:hypothetical protein
MKAVVFMILFFSSAIANSQNLTGTWEGTIGNEFMRLVVIHQKDSVFGYTYDDVQRNGRRQSYCKASFSGIYTFRKLKGKGVDMLQISGSHTMSSFNLDYSKEDYNEYLHGSAKAKGAFLQIITMGLGEPVYLKKVSEIPDTIAYMKMRLARLTKPVKPTPEIVVKPALPKPITDTLKKPAAPVTISVPVAPKIEIKNQRISKLIRTISTNADTIKISVYDNGQVDDDSVTVFFDNKILLDNYRISDKAKELYLPVSKDREHTIELFANNLGSIPPNTALIIIQAGKERYELYASYDLKTNAQIVIRYKE